MALLKPCPFCGGSNLQLRIKPPFIGEVHCCDCLIDMVIKEYPLDGDLAEQLVKIWNRREYSDRNR